MFFKKVRSYEEHLITTRLWILKETKTNKNYRSYRSMFKIHSENRNRKCEPCNTSKLSLCCKQVIETSTLKGNASFARWNAHYAKPNPLKKRIGVNNHRKDVSNPKSIPADLHLRKPGYSFNLHAKFTLIKQLSHIHTTYKDIIKFRLKRCEDFWIQKLETLTPKGLNQELNNV